MTTTTTERTLLLVKPDAVDGVLALCGPTEPTVAPPGTIRGDLGHDWGHGVTENVVHRSDAAASAEREVALWFPVL